jgi:hypothetical protein
MVEQELKDQITEQAEVVVAQVQQVQMVQDKMLEQVL